ncbi:MAG: CDP-diacylglycerol--serine O-phosphatidyltransferase [Muribaculaceae bacterium]|nr:CDP-diacylglycerol--serine O-phosphatidyltransferase [Muribaculaceae bacterium]
MNILKKIRSNIPNAITCLNVLCGTIAILIAAHPQLSYMGLQAWQWASLFIVFAAVADFFDGFAARMLHECHPIGADLDSLSDQVSFGVAPAALLASSLWGNVPIWLAFMPAIIPVATAVRLAKFNVDTRQTTGFLGMPVPANAVFWIGYVASIKYGAFWLESPWALIPALLLLSWLMVSEVPMLSLKFKTWGFKDNLARYLLIIGSAVLLICFQLPGMLWIIVFYAVMSLLFGRQSSSTH